MASLHGTRGEGGVAAVRHGGHGSTSRHTATLVLTHRRPVCNHTAATHCGKWHHCTGHGVRAAWRQSDTGTRIHIKAYGYISIDSQTSCL
ncbi:hypothetical protein LSM04_000824 [Trypanosoma melophagium]|uniref:uncharacterized protein n=1 Tax=Trypanosoma melophagium TaxID=715481 RepID=UPI003519F056|nr:hypothetical protein LSM04_000824 [Trypanosoma melophagium]